MANFLETRKAAYLFLSLFALFFAYTILNYYGGNDYAGDGLRHYIVSRWSWKHPDLLLYHWGKPFYTIVSSPFSQSGHKGIQIFNLILSLGGAYSLFKICQHYAIKNSALVILMTFSTPVFFSAVNTGLTEPLFFFLVAYSTHLVLKEKYFSSALLISFLPFVRSEGNIIIMFFILVFILRNKYRYIPLLFTGTFIYSIIGGFYFKNFLWVFTENPYNGSNRSFYGQGELLSFVKAYKEVLGLPLTILFVSGVLYYIINLKRKSEFALNIQSVISVFKKHDVEILILFCAPVAYFIAHSIFWWKGLYNSLGLVRVMAGIAPLTSIACLRGLNMAENILFKRAPLRPLFIIAISIYFLSIPFSTKCFPPKLNDDDKVAVHALSWFRNSPYKDKLIFYLNPFIPDQLDRDPFDPNQVRELWGLYPSIKEFGYSVIPDSTIIFWDSHYGPNECLIPLDTISNDPNFSLLKIFKPDIPFKTLGGYDFGIYLFEKISSNQRSILSSSMLFDLETPDGLENTHTITDKESNSGTRSSLLDEVNEYGILYSVPVNNLNKFGQIKKVDYGFYIKSDQKISKAKVVLSISIGDRTLEWMGKSIETMDSDNGKWSKHDFEFNITPEAYSGNNVQMNIYIWNPKKEKFFIDDIEIKFAGIQNN